MSTLADILIDLASPLLLAAPAKTVKKAAPKKAAPKKKVVKKLVKKAAPKKKVVKKVMPEEPTMPPQPPMPELASSEPTPSA